MKIIIREDRVEKFVDQEEWSTGKRGIWNVHYGKIRRFTGGLQP